MGIYIYPEKYLADLTKTHLRVISGFDPNLSFSTVLAKNVLGEPFRSVFQLLFKLNADKVCQKPCSVGRKLIYDENNFDSAFSDLVIMPGYPSDPHIMPSERTKGIRLGDRAGYIFKDKVCSILHYDATNTPWKYRASELMGKKYFFRSLTNNYVELTRPEIIFHEMAHLEFMFSVAPFLPEYATLSNEFKEFEDESYAIDRTNQYRSWKLKKWDVSKLRKDHSAKIETWSKKEESIEVLEEMIEDAALLINSRWTEQPDLESYRVGSE